MSTAATRICATSRTEGSWDDGQLEPEQVGDLPHAADLVADPERDVVRRPLGAPVVEERSRSREADARVRVPDAEGGARRADSPPPRGASVDRRRSGSARGW